MQVWLQRTVGCIALSSLVVFWVQISGGCVGLVGVGGWVGSLGVQGVALVRTRVFVFAMYRMGLVAAP